MWRRN
jgi:hypothetical protein